jgi:hypothetical protein
VFDRKEPCVHEKHNPIERAIIGLVAAAIAVNVLATTLPLVMPYVVVLAVLFVVVRLVLFHTRKW